MGNCCSGKKTPYPPAEKARDISGSDLRGIIAEQCKPHTIHVADRNYSLVKSSSVKAFLSSDDVNQIKYRAENFDCDDFAMVLCGRSREWFYGNGTSIAFGIVHGDLRQVGKDDQESWHAINFFVDENDRVIFVEPQNDKFLDLNMSKSTITMVMC